MATFCVTGASGFVAAEIVAHLLDEGHAVRGTVRDTSKPYDHLRQLPGADERLTLHDADLLDDGSFAEAVQGCDYVLHTASPYVLDVEDPQGDLVDPAVGGVRNVLQSCLKVDGLKRVVLTSSYAAVTEHGRDGYVFDENDWNTTSSLDRNPYYYSKVQAEQAAWDFCTQHEPAWDLVVLNPTAVIGPARTDSVNQSNQVFIQVADDGQPVLSLQWVFVDVRDVARAHLLAATEEQAAGRFVIGADTRSARDIAELVKQTYSQHKVSPMALDNAFGSWLIRTIGWRTLPTGTGTYVRTNVGHELRADNSKSRTVLGLEYRDVDQTIIETIDDLIARGHVTNVDR